MELVTVSSASARGTSAALDALADHAAAGGHLGGPDGAGDQRGDADVPGLCDAEHGQHGDRRRCAEVTIWPISRTRLRFTASDITPAKAPSSSIGMRARGGDDGDGEAGSGHVEREQRGGQHLEPAHRVDAAANRPEAEEGGATERSSARSAVRWRT